MFSQDAQSNVVDDVAVRVDYAILTVAGVGVECNVSQDPKLWKTLLERCDHARYEAVGVHGLGTVKGLECGINHGEQRHDRDAERHAFFGDWQECVQGVPFDPWHGSNGLPDTLSLGNKHWVNQVIH